MRSCSEAPHLCGMSWLLASTSLLLSICSAGVESSGEHGSSGEDSGVPVPVTGIQGGSALIQIGNSSWITSVSKLAEIRWKFKNTTAEINIVRATLPLTEANLKWFIDEDKQRLSVPNHLSLRIESLTHEDTGQYQAEVTSTTGRAFKEIFFLTVYEPVPLPQILVQSKSITRDWCNISLECTGLGTTKDLNVTWESPDLLTELEQRETPRPAPKPWTLALSLRLSQSNSSLICVVSNPVDQKNVTQNLAEVCQVPETKSERSRHILIIIVVLTVLILGLGFYLWRICRKKKTETQRGSRMQAHGRGHEDAIQYADIIHPVIPENQYETIGQRQEAHTTVYSTVCSPGQAALT